MCVIFILGEPVNFSSERMGGGSIAIKIKIPIFILIVITIGVSDYYEWV